LTGKYINTPVMIVNEEDYKKIVKADKKRIYIGGKDKTIVIL
jgi:hypothetical protein